MFAVITIGGNKKIIIPFEYANFKNLFRKKKGKKVLSKYQS
jgi:hypothetical protein